MKKLLKILGIIIVILFAFLAIGYLVINESMPEGKQGPEADAMAQRMMNALNYEGWKATDQIRWTFRGGHSYDWNKAEDLVTVRWGQHEVILNTDTQTGIVSNGQNYSFDEVNGLVQTAIDFFNNDSFWLAAPFKAFDPGTERSIVELSDGRQGLMVTYTSGGSTPGDSYVWILDEEDKPVAIKMWVQILPIGGMEFTWENYMTLPSGAMIAQDHLLFGGMNVELTGIQ
jgi:hypothetical protein